MPERKICVEKRAARDSETGKSVFDIEPGDALILPGDVKRGIAIPPKRSFAQYAKTLFGKGDGSNG